MCAMTQSDHHGVDPTPHRSSDVPFRCGLSRDQECEMAASIAGGDQAARNSMVRANLGLVVTIARAFQGRGLVLDDLVGEGNLGLIRAAERFDPRFGLRFSTYAGYWIKESIRHALIKTTSTIRLPAHMVRLLTKWHLAERSLHREWGRVPNFDELSSFLGLSESQKSLVAKAHRARHLELESAMGSGAGHRSPEELADRYEPAESMIEAEDERRMLLGRLERLNLRERTVLALRYGLEGEEPLTLTEIGRRLGVTRECVRKIEIRAVCRLRSTEEEDRVRCEVSWFWREHRGSSSPPSIKPSHRAGSPKRPVP